jgi:hypothetical protein
MTKPPKKPKLPGPDVAAFRALRDSKKSFIPGAKGGPQKPTTQKPRAKQQLRRRP